MTTLNDLYQTIDHLADIDAVHTRTGTRLRDISRQMAATHLINEAAEVFHAVHDERGHKEYVAAVLDELADVMAVTAHLAQLLDIPPEQLMAMSISKVQHRFRVAKISPALLLYRLPSESMARAAAKELVEKSSWFRCEPLPNGQFEITVKNEVAKSSSEFPCLMRGTLITPEGEKPK